MAFDTLVLGPFVFDGFSPPEGMPLGGEQKLVVHKMPGGLRAVDAMGADDHDPSWEGILFGETAFADMLTLDAMRKSGQELAFSWGAESRTVVIQRFRARVEKQNVIHYEITLVYTDSSAGTASSAAYSATSLIVSDLTSALSI